MGRWIYNRWICLGISCFIGFTYLFFRSRQEPLYVPLLTLEQAQAKFPHRILIPKEIPPGFHLLGVRVYRPYVVVESARSSHYVPKENGFGLMATPNCRTAPYPMAMGQVPCSPIEASGIRAGDKILAMGDNIENYSLKGMNNGRFRAIGAVIKARMRKTPGDLFRITFQHEDESPKTWRSPYPKPYYLCLDRKPPPLHVTLLFDVPNHRGGFDILEEEPRINLNTEQSQGGIDIGGDRWFHPSGMPNRPSGCWKQNGLDLQILNNEGLLMRNKVVEIAGSIS